jgi:hypothetical protein
MSKIKSLNFELSAQSQKCQKWFKLFIRLKKVNFIGARATNLQPYIDIKVLE